MFSPQLFIGHHVAVPTKNVSCLSSVMTARVPHPAHGLRLPHQMDVYEVTSSLNLNASQALLRQVREIHFLIKLYIMKKIRLSVSLHRIF